MNDTNNLEYYFGYGIGQNNKPSLEAVKVWIVGGKRRFDTLTVKEYGTFNEAGGDERELERIKDEYGIEAALNFAESIAVLTGHLDPNRDDPRIFFEDDAPADRFTTNRERELTTAHQSADDDDEQADTIAQLTAEVENLKTKLLAARQEIHALQEEIYEMEMQEARERRDGYTDLA